MPVPADACRPPLPRRRWRLACLLAGLLGLAGAAPAAAQSELMLLLDPRMGQQTFRGDYGLTWYPSEPVRRQPTELEMVQHRVSFSLPLFQSAQQEWGLSGLARLQEYDTEAVLPATGVRFPEELWNFQLGATYRRKLENDWIAGGGVTVGTASDEPFASEDELYYRAFAFLRIPHRERHAWLLSLFYTSGSGDLAGIPFPGIAYIYAPSETFRAIIGVPASSVEYRPLERLTLEASYLPLRRVQARATYRVAAPWRVYVGFDWDSEWHYLADRGDTDDRLYYYEKRLTAGTRFDLRHVGLDVRGGWAFDRFFFEGESYGDRRDNRIEVDSGPFVSVRLNVRF